MSALSFLQRFFVGLIENSCPLFIQLLDTLDRRFVPHATCPFLAFAEKLDKEVQEQK
jgi:hypothetical protein